VAKGHKFTAVIFVALILLLMSSLLVASAVGASGSADDSPMFRHDLTHSGYATDGPTNFVKLLWTFSTGAAVWSSPAVVDGFVYVGSRDGNVYCLNSSSGVPLWNYQTYSVIEFSSPAVVDGCVYIGADNGNLYSLNATTGMPFWSSFVGGTVRSSPAVVDGRVFVGAWDHRIHCLNASDGAELWSFPTWDAVDSSPAVVDGVVYIGCTDNSLYALNASSGAKIWSQHTGSGALSSPSVSGGYVYMGSNDGALYAFNVSNGEIVWKFQTEDSIVSSPAIANGCVYFGSEDNYLYCLNAVTSDKVWASRTGYWVWSSPTVANGNVYVGSEDYNIYCFNASNGAQKWVYPTFNAVDSSPVVAEGKLYVGSDDFTIYAFTDSPVATTGSGYPVATFAIVVFDVLACVIAGGIIFAVVFSVRQNWRAKRNAQTQSEANGALTWAKSRLDALCILAILAFSVLFFINMTGEHLWVADEQTYTQWAYHMLRTGDFMNEWAFGGMAIWIGKPPLFMWMISFAYQIFGVTNFAARSVSAVLGTLSLVVIFYLGKKLYNQYVGLMSALVLGTFFTFFIFARHAMTDVPMVFFMIASIYFLVDSEKAKHANVWAALSGVFFGLALMTKQLEALVIPLVLFCYLIVSQKSLRFLITKRFTIFWGMGLLIFMPWVIYESTLFQSFFQWFFVYSNIQRTVGVIEGHPGGYLYYFQYLVNNENPVWLAILPFGVALAAYKAAVKRVKADILIVVWIVAVLALFSIAQTKLYWYIIPVLPAFALAIGSLFYQIIRKIRMFTRSRKNQVHVELRDVETA